MDLVQDMRKNAIMSKISFYNLGLLEAKIYADSLGHSGPCESKDGISSPKAIAAIHECPSFVLSFHEFLTYHMFIRPPPGQGFICKTFELMSVKGFFFSGTNQVLFSHWLC